MGGLHWAPLFFSKLPHVVCAPWCYDLQDPRTVLLSHLQILSRGCIAPSSRKGILSSFLTVHGSGAAGVFPVVGTFQANRTQNVSGMSLDWLRRFTYHDEPPGC